MLLVKVFIRKLVPIDRERASSIAFHEITTLAHEVRHHSVEGRVFVPLRTRIDSEFSCTKLTKVLGRPGE